MRTKYILLTLVFTFLFTSCEQVVLPGVSTPSEITPVFTSDVQSPNTNLSREELIQLCAQADPPLVPGTKWEYHTRNIQNPDENMEPQCPHGDCSYSVVQEFDTVFTINESMVMEILNPPFYNQGAHLTLDITSYHCTHSVEFWGACNNHNEYTPGCLLSSYSLGDLNCEIGVSKAICNGPVYEDSRYELVSTFKSGVGLTVMIKKIININAESQGHYGVYSYEKSELISNASPISLEDPLDENGANLDETRIRYILVDIQLSGLDNYYRNFLNDQNAVEAFLRWDSGIRVSNIKQFERKLINGQWVIVYKGTETVINGADVILTSD